MIFLKFKKILYLSILGIMLAPTTKAMYDKNLYEEQAKYMNRLLANSQLIHDTVVGFNFKLSNLASNQSELPLSHEKILSLFNKITEKLLKGLLDNEKMKEQLIHLSNMLLQESDLETNQVTDLNAEVATLLSMTDDEKEQITNLKLVDCVKNAMPMLLSMTEEANNQIFDCINYSILVQRIYLDGIFSSEQYTEPDQYATSLKDAIQSISRYSYACLMVIKQKITNKEITLQEDFIKLLEAPLSWLSSIFERHFDAEIYNYYVEDYKRAKDPFIDGLIGYFKIFPAIGAHEKYPEIGKKLLMNVFSEGKEQQVQTIMQKLNDIKQCAFTNSTPVSVERVQSELSGLIDCQVVNDLESSEEKK